MATATKPRGTRSARSPATKPAAAGGVTLSIGIAMIDPSPFNPRKDFSMEKIDELAASIRAHGLLQPIVVRLKGRRYELVAGHRRLVAATRAGLKQIPAAVRELDDFQAREVALVENVQRADLNAVEEAEGLKAILYPGHGVRPGGPTQVELAERLGCSQGHIANRLRLLTLPAAWRKRIISGEISPRHAREVLPYVKHPAILASIEKEMARAARREHGIGTVEDFRDDIVVGAVGAVTELIEGSHFDRKLGRQVPVFTPTEEEKQQLKLVEVDFGEHYGGKTQRAANVVLWKRLQAQHAKAWVKEQAAKGKSKGKAAVAKKNGKPKKLTAAQQKAAAAEERRRAAEQAVQFRRRLYEWKINWLRYLIAKTIGEGVETWDLVRLLLYFAADRISRRIPARCLTRLCHERGVKVPHRNLTPAVWIAVAGLENDEAIQEVAVGFLAAGFWDAKEGPSPCVPDDDVEAIAALLCIDLAAAWKAGPQAGPLSEAYWNLHSIDQLGALIRESKVTIQPARTKADTVRQLMAAKKMPCPKEIVKVKRPR